MKLSFIRSDLRSSGIVILKSTWVFYRDSLMLSLCAFLSFANVSSISLLRPQLYSEVIFKSHNNLHLSKKEKKLFPRTSSSSEHKTIPISQYLINLPSLYISISLKVKKTLRGTPSLAADLPLADHARSQKAYVPPSGASRPPACAQLRLHSS